MPADGRWDLILCKGLKCPLTLILLTWRIWWAPNNASGWQMGFNSAFKGVKCPVNLILLTWRIWWAPNNASRWQMGFNLAFTGLKCPLTLTLLTWRIWWANNASRWQMGFNSAFKGLKCPLTLTLLTWIIWRAPNNASRWQMGFNPLNSKLNLICHLLALLETHRILHVSRLRVNSAFKGFKYPLTLTLLTWRIWWAPNNASRWQVGFNWAFKGLNSLLKIFLNMNVICSLHFRYHVLWNRAGTQLYPLELLAL